MDVLEKFSFSGFGGIRLDSNNVALIDGQSDVVKKAKEMNEEIQMEDKQGQEERLRQREKFAQVGRTGLGEEVRQ